MDLRFLSPINGDVLHSRDGEFVDGKLMATVCVEGPAGKCIAINGVSAKEENGVYTAVVPLSGYPVEVVATCDCGATASVKVFVAPEFAGKYRVSIDDAIWFLRDIHENNYDSLFENPYLKFFRELHEEFGTVLHLNLYLDDIDSALGDGGFSLRMMSDKYKKEWQENANWIRLSFHAKSDSPPKPYLDAPYEKVYADAKAVHDEIVRFAGEELLGKATTVHWGEATMDGIRALRDVGWNVFPCDFNVDDNLPACSFYLSVEERRHMKKRFVWHDDRIGVTFFRCAIITDTKKLEEIPTFLDQINEDPIKSVYMDMLIHEQYFYEKYPLYQENYRDKVRATVEWAVKNGYQPGFLSDVLHG